MHATLWINIENIILSEGSQSKDHILYDSIDMKWSEQLNRQKVDEWCLGLGTLKDDG